MARAAPSASAGDHEPTGGPAARRGSTALACAGFTGVRDAQARPRSPRRLATRTGVCPPFGDARGTGAELTLISTPSRTIRRGAPISTSCPSTADDAQAEACDGLQRVDAGQGQVAGFCGTAGWACADGVLRLRSAAKATDGPEGGLRSRHPHRFQRVRSGRPCSACGLSKSTDAAAPCNA